MKVIRKRKRKNISSQNEMERSLSVYLLDKFRAATSEIEDRCAATLVGYKDAKVVVLESSS